jgi:hypothetical protein
MRSDYRLIYNKLRGLFAKSYKRRNYQIYFSIGNSVDRVHGAWIGRRTRVHGGSGGGANIHAAEAKEGEGNKAKPMRGSSEHGRWW